MHLVRLIAVAATAGALAGCGADGDARPRASATPSPTRTAERPIAPPTVTYDLTKDPDAWPALRGGVLALRRGPATLVPAPDPGPVPVRVEAEVVLPDRGRAGVFCGPYGLAVGADGGYALYRLGRGAPDPVFERRLDASGRSDPGEPTLVRLVCVPGALGFQINASPLSYAKNTDAPVESTDRVGALAVGPGGRARFNAFGIGEAPRPGG